MANHKIKGLKKEEIIKMYPKWENCGFKKGMTSWRKGKTGFKHSEETKKKIGISNSIALLGKKQSKETIEKRVKKMRGRKVIMTEEWRKNLSESHKGKIHAGTFKKGHKHSKETLEKISKANKGRKLSKEHIEKLRGRKPWNYIDGRSKFLGPARYGDDWDKIRYLVYLRDKFTCQHCAIKGERLDVHHKIPFLISFDNSLGNLISLCRRCHRIEEARIMKEIKNKKMEGKEIECM